MHWQKLLAEAITDPYELLRLLDLSPEQFVLASAKIPFPLRVPRNYIARMQRSNARDPLLLQVLPLAEETLPTPGFEKDILQEAQCNPIPGVLHKYHGRVLLIATGACGIHCRYCFRQHFAYAENSVTLFNWDQALAYITKDTSITEVILSGGDPLALTDAKLITVCKQLETIPHVKRLRFHTRMPIVLPERVTDDLLEGLQSMRLSIVMVLHVNHANEINHDVMVAMKRLRDSNVLLLNQSVLLRQINDDVDTLVALSEALFSAHMLPYYLHMPDNVVGTAHFTVTEDHARALVWGMMEKLPGYLVPKLVREQPGALTKIPVNL